MLGLIVPDTETSGRDLVAMIHDLLHHPERYVSNENENMRRDGQRVWITWRNTPITDAEGRLIEIVSTGIDSTDRKRADDALRASEERFRELAVRDNLTGLYNTRHLYQALEALIAVGRRDRAIFSVLFIDLDHFKRVVDARGHLNGSRAIQEVAATIRDCLEPPAWAVAYAGDEFVVVLPGRGARGRAGEGRGHQGEDGRDARTSPDRAPRAPRRELRHRDLPRRRARPRGVCSRSATRPSSRSSDAGRGGIASAASRRRRRNV